jgi:hypothetical protein
LGDPVDALTPLITKEKTLLRIFGSLEHGLIGFLTISSQVVVVSSGIRPNLQMELWVLLWKQSCCTASAFEDTGIWGPPHTFQDYFEMLTTLARDCCCKHQFDLAIKALYQMEYLQLPTKKDMEALIKLRKHQHGVDGMFGFLDCMHTFWTNCPKAWQGSFEGAKGRHTKYCFGGHSG